MAGENYGAYQKGVVAPAVKSAADAAARLTRTIKGIERATAQGDVDRIGTLTSGLAELAVAADRAAGELAQATGRFNVDTYLADSFHDEFEAACRAQNLPLEGRFPTYEVFPLRVRIVSERHRAVIGSRTVRQLEPGTLAALIRKDVDALSKRSFNAPQFLKEVSHAYDVCVALKERQSSQKNKGTATISRGGLPVDAREVYSELAPTRAAQQSYTVSMFAYDLGRLQQSAERSVDGRQIKLGSTREGGRALRSFDAAGREIYIGTITFEREAE